MDYHLGVKRVECVGEVFKINGRNVKLRGVNRHDHHPRTGRYVDDATYEEDIRLMKQANVNFLRTSHYPDRELLYELDVLVDGPFIESLRDTDLLFRGSSNQRLIDVQKSLYAGEVVLWQPDVDIK